MYTCMYRLQKPDFEVSMKMVMVIEAISVCSFCDFSSSSAAAGVFSTSKEC